MAEKRKLKRLQMEKTTLSSAAVVSNERFDDMYNDDDDNDGPGFEICDGDDNYSVGNDCQSSHGNNSNDQDFGGIFSAYYHEDGNEERTFEELCRAHLKEFAKGAEKYAMESQLSKRVDSWQSKVSIVLQEEEERPEFDIQSYSNQILSNAQQSIQNKTKSVSNDSCEIPFVSVTMDQEPYDVSRLFLASLMLCNSENIKFSGINVGHVTSPDQLRVKVLKAQVESHVDDYFGNTVENNLSNQQMVAN
jgi:condensin-2 complex subunit H2